MPSAPTLTLTDYQGPTRWRWLLTDAKGKYLADHEVQLDPAAIQYRGYLDLPTYLRDFSASRTERDLLAEVGAWMGEHVFGGALAKALRALPPAPATPIRLVIPAAAQDLVFRPFELAHLDGQTFAARGIRFVYEVAPSPEAQSKDRGPKLRVLAVFSLPSGATPLGLRRERRELGQLLRRVAQTQSAAIELRVLQYGATRHTLRAALENEDGWDIVHFSGHGLAGEIVLEDARGAADKIDASELLPLLLPARARLALITLSCCFSAAATVASARAAVGLDAPTRAGDGPEATALPSVAQHLAAGLDCAVLAMRYPIEDGFATRLVMGLFDRLLDKKKALPDALQLALRDAGDEPPLSPVTPVLFGGRAVDLKLAPPPAPPDFALPRVGLFDFPPEPRHFVGRLKPMLEASAALAPEGEHRGVLFYGMAGAGKTSCALELAYRHERGRFPGYVWYQAPNEGDDVGTALASFLIAVEAQLAMDDRALLAHLADPEAFKKKTLPRLKGLLQSSAVLIAIDNVEGLLTSSNGWRDPLWGDVIATLLDHGGLSRVVLTSRRLPASVEKHPRLVRVSMHALSFPESVLLARELPNLSKLFKTAEGRLLLRRTLEAVQGHPKLLDLADKLAVDPAALERHLGPAGTLGSVVAAEGEGPAARFFAVGETELRDEAFVAELKRWAEGIGATLPAEARLVMAFLCRVEDEDRVQLIVEDNWKDFLERLTGARGGKDDGSGRAGEETRALADKVLAMPGMALEASVDTLVMSGLVERVERIPEEGTDPEEERDRRAYRIHPAIAEATLDKTEAAVSAAVDVELGNFWLVMFQHGFKNEMKGTGPMIVEGGKHAVPYLLRVERWEEAAIMLEQVIARDATPKSLALVLPRLRYIVAATAGTVQGGTYMGVLPGVLFRAGHVTEAERMGRDLIEKCAAHGDYILALGIANDLANIFRVTGRSEEALAVAETLAMRIRLAGLGRRTQLFGEAHRLQILNSMGKYAEVLSVVQGLREELRVLAEATDNGQEVVAGWNVHGALLGAGASAALGLERWEEALDLNREQVRISEQRGASATDVLRVRFNGSGPLLGLKRCAEARVLLQACQAGFEDACDIEMLGKVFGALAHLEYTEGQYSAAIRFEENSLVYAYQSHAPESCAGCHHNMAGYLKATKVDSVLALAHRVAAGSIYIQIGSGRLAPVVHDLATSSTLPAAPPSFAEVVAAVEQSKGVRFADLFARLPKRVPDGDAAITAVWALVQEERARSPARPDMARVLREFDRPLRALAAATRDGAARPDLEDILRKLAEAGWELTAAVHRIWEGERDASSLTAGIDPENARLVERILELVDQPLPEEVLASTPPAIKAAFQLRGAAFNQAMHAALAALPPEEAQRLVEQLRQAGLLG